METDLMVRSDWLRRAFLSSVMVPAYLMLAACGGAPPATFDLNAAHDFSGMHEGSGSLAVLEPSASMPFASERIVMRTAPEAVAYLKGAQWADELPRLIQARLIDSFENAHALRAVGRPGLVANWSLQTEVRRFEADVTNGQARIEISANLLTANGHIVTSKVFSAQVPAPKDDATTVTAALDQALTSVLHQIVLWVAPKAARG
jgi:cholesterol transport system auxiliary component